MTTLAEFLLARIAEDEAQARDATQGTWHPSDQGWEGDDSTRFITAPYHELDISADDQRHITRWRPGRVLAECDAKRRIMQEHQGCNGWCDVCSVELSQTEKQAAHWPCETLHLLALPYADHPDYRQEWTP